MRKGFIVSSFLLLAAGPGCSADPAEGNMAAAGTTGFAGSTGLAGGAGSGGTAQGVAGMTSFAGMSAGGTPAVGGAGASAGGAGGSGGGFVVIVGGQGGGGAGGAAQGGGGAGGAAQGGGGAGGQAQGGGGAGGGGNQGNNPCSYLNWDFTATDVCDGTPDCMFDATQRLPAGAIDGNMTTRYTSGHPQDGTEEYTIHFPASVTLSGITVAHSAGDEANMYAIEYSTNGTTFMAFNPAAEGAGVANLVVTFPEPTSMTDVKIKQTGTTVTPWWSILEITVQGCMAD